MALIKTIKRVREAVRLFNDIYDEFKQVKQLILTHDSDADGEPDYRQIVVQSKKVFGLTKNLVNAVIAELTDDE